MERRLFRIFSLVVNILILTISFLFWVWLKPASVRHYLPTHLPFFITLAIIWLIVSLINGKMNRGKIVNLRSLFLRVLTSNIISLALATMLMYSFREYNYSRSIVLGTVALATAFELLAGLIFLAFKKAVVQETEFIKELSEEPGPTELEMVGEIGSTTIRSEALTEDERRVKDSLTAEVGDEMACGILAMAGGTLNGNSAVLSTGTRFNINNLPLLCYDYIINVRRMNTIPDINTFLDAINGKLAEGGRYFCCVETKNQRKARILKKYWPPFNYIIYTFDFLIKRVLPKLRLTKGIYNILFGRSAHVMSRAESLGRLCRAGFRIEKESFIGSQLCIEVRKSGQPLPHTNSNYGALIALNRIGRGGKLFRVYKLRTMHPYSEFLQDYVYRLHSLSEGGKFRHDFRITSWGQLCRTIWLDELPMLLNLIRGEMKLVGVRPLSQQYFSLYSPEMQERRVKYKPGLVPPFYVDMPANLEEIQESERRYLDAYDKRPLRTDICYFWRSVWNILIRKARSR